MSSLLLRRRGLLMQMNESDPPEDPNDGKYTVVSYVLSGSGYNTSVYNFSSSVEMSQTYGATWIPVKSGSALLGCAPPYVGKVDGTGSFMVHAPYGGLIYRPLISASTIQALMSLAGAGWTGSSTSSAANLRNGYGQGPSIFMAPGESPTSTIPYKGQWKKAASRTSTALSAFFWGARNVNGTSQNSTVVDGDQCFIPSNVGNSTRQGFSDISDDGNYTILSYQSGSTMKTHVFLATTQYQATSEGSGSFPFTNVKQAALSDDGKYCLLVSQNGVNAAKSTNYISTWEELDLGLDPRVSKKGCAVSRTGRVQYVTTDAGVMRSKDYGKTWKKVNSSSLDAIKCNGCGRIALAFSGSNTYSSNSNTFVSRSLWRTDDYGETWVNISSALTQNTSIAAGRRRYLFDFNIYRSPNAQ